MTLLSFTGWNVFNIYFTTRVLFIIAAFKYIIRLHDMKRNLEINSKPVKRNAKEKYWI